MYRQRSKGVDAQPITVVTVFDLDIIVHRQGVPYYSGSGSVDGNERGYETCGPTLGPRVWAAGASVHCPRAERYQWCRNGVAVYQAGSFEVGLRFGERQGRDLSFGESSGRGSMAVGGALGSKFQHGHLQPSLRRFPEMNEN